VDQHEPTPFPRVPEPSDAELAQALAEVDAAIALVRGGAAVRIRLVGFALAEAIAGLAAAHAQLARVAFRIDRPDGDGMTAIIVGPLD
jgi:hypothetical protein